MLEVLVVAVVVLVVAAVQVRRRSSRLMRPDNAPPGRVTGTGGPDEGR